jgi:subtilisin-like proprotein convertase family protein
MSIFSKKPVEDEVSEMENNIGTMQDDVAKIITNKNHNNAMAKNLRRFGARLPATGRSREIQRDLADVYTDNDGQIPDLTRLDRSERPLWQTILYVLVAVFSVLLVVSIAGFLVFSNLNSETFTNERVVFKIEPPISIISGQEQTYTIIISNNEKVNLYNLNIALIYPDAFQFVSSSPEATGDKNNNWDISVLKVGETKEIKLAAKVSAPLNSIQNISGTMTFKPENLNADFNQKVSVDLGVNSSVLVMTIEGTEKLLANKNTEYIVTLKNIGSDVLKDIEVTAEFPKGFIAASSTPDSKDGFNNVWTIDKLATSTDGTSTSSEKKIKIRGNYSGVVDSGNQELNVKAMAKISGNSVLMAEQSYITNIVKDQLNLTLVINGSGEDQSVGFGDMLFYTLAYKNTGQDELKNIELKANLISDVLDWDTLLDNDKGKKKGDTITWTGKEVSKLLSLRPGDEGEISWQIRVKDLSTLNQGDITKYNIENFVEAKVTNKDGGTDTITSKVLTNSINSDLSLQASARYYDENNVALGAGSIQPKAGSASSYNVKLTLSNNLHNIGNIIVTAILPRNVNWDNKEFHNTGDVAYSAKARKITWMISKLPKTAQGTEANFNLSITPTDNDMGRVLILLPEVQMIAKDLDTGADISKTVKAITASFNDPILGQVSGIVE